MKTSELKKIVEDNGATIKLDRSSWEIDCGKQYFGHISTEGVIDFNISSLCPKVIAQAILDYAYTPLEEREEEKKYRLKLSSQFNSVIDNYLNYHIETKKWFFKDIHETNEYKTSFTQKEIDEMPFDTNFFIKDEVSEK